MKAEQLIDCEGITLESAKPFAFSCCDCGLTHHMVIVSEDGKPVGFAVKRVDATPAQDGKDARTDSVHLDSGVSGSVQAPGLTDADRTRQFAHLEATPTDMEVYMAAGVSVEAVRAPAWKLRRAAEILERDGDEYGVAADLRAILASTGPDSGGRVE